jgi:signal peptidase
MRLSNVLRTAVALLSQLYLTLLITFAATAMIPVAFHWEPTIVMSGSMEPTVMTGDVIVAMPISKDKLNESVKVGHVLLAKDALNPGALITHRVVKILPDNAGYITKGDANESVDINTLLPENIKGVERIRVPYIGIPIQALKTGNPIPAVIFLVVTIFAQISASGEKARIRQAENKERFAADPTLTRAKLRKHNKKLMLIKTTSSLAGVAALVVCFLMTGNSNATFVSTTETAVSTWTSCSVAPPEGTPCPD